MKKFILVGFQNLPTEPKILKEFYNGRFDIVQTIAGFTSAELTVKYSTGLDGALIFNSENAAGLVQQALNASFHGRYNSWCVRELTEQTTTNTLLIDYLKSNKHIKRYAKKLAELAA